jgi:hypothetical protein
VSLEAQVCPICGKVARMKGDLIFESSQRRLLSKINV